MRLFNCRFAGARIDDSPRVIDPILRRTDRWNSGHMHNKLENGHTAANLDKFLRDIKTVVEDGEALLRASATELKGRGLEAAKSTDRMVRSHPYQTLGIVLGLGLVVGLLATGAFSGESEERE